MTTFKSYLMLEARSHLGHKVGDILTAVQTLHDDSAHLGTRQLVQSAKGIVNQIKRILHDDWPDTEMNTLKTLQRVGVALMKGIDDNQDLKEILDSVVQELQSASNELGEPVNSIGSQNTPEDMDD